MEIPIALTYDDVTIVPNYSDISSRKDISLKTRVSKNVWINIPIISSNMDTVTEERMAIEMARHGGLGIIHRYCSIDEQVKMIEAVKQADRLIVHTPHIVYDTQKVRDVKSLVNVYGVKTFLVYNVNGELAGMLTNRDYCYRDDDFPVNECMTTEYNVINVTKDHDHKDLIKHTKEAMIRHKLQKVIVKASDDPEKLIFLKDIIRTEKHPSACLDRQGRLMCGAAIGVGPAEIGRADKLIKAGVDVIFLDIAHGHMQKCYNMVRRFKERFPFVDIVAGNVATPEGAKFLVDAGADGIKVGVGSGSICITRKVAGVGVPQFSAVYETAQYCLTKGIPVISDGGAGNSGNMAKGLAAGADCFMLGRMIAGTDESPGRIFIKDGKRVKIIRGMAGFGANIANSQRQNKEEPDSLKFTSEGVEGFVPYCGPLEDTLKQLCDGIRSGMSYIGAKTISESRELVKFRRNTLSGIKESGPHNIINF